MTGVRRNPVTRCVAANGGFHPSARTRSALFEAQPAQPRRYVHAVILASEER
jgi:hypothetical protein